MDVIKSECGNRDFGTALQLLALNPIDADCHLIKIACKGIGTNEFMLATVLCGRTNKEMEALKVSTTAKEKQDIPHSISASN